MPNLGITYPQDDCVCCAATARKQCPRRPDSPLRKPVSVRDFPRKLCTEMGIILSGNYGENGVDAPAVNRGTPSQYLFPQADTTRSSPLRIADRLPLTLQDQKSFDVRAF